MAESALDKAKELQDRTKRFAIRIVKMFKALPKTDEARMIGKQVLWSGTSVAANYRAACRARSKAEFAAKMGVVVEEIDETVYGIACRNRNCADGQAEPAYQRGQRAACYLCRVAQHGTKEN